VFFEGSGRKATILFDVEQFEKKALKRTQINRRMLFIIGRNCIKNIFLMVNVTKISHWRQIYKIFCNCF
jgi:hypothetical protein